MGPLPGFRPRLRLATILVVVLLVAVHLAVARAYGKYLPVLGFLLPHLVAIPCDLLIGGLALVLRWPASHSVPQSWLSGPFLLLLMDVAPLAILLLVGATACILMAPDPIRINFY